VLTRADLVAELTVRHPHLRQGDIELIVLTVFNEVASALARGQRVELRRFGTFTLKRAVDGKATPYVTAGKELHARLNRP